MKRQTRGTKYSDLRNKINQTIELEENTSLETAKVTKLKGQFNKLDDSFFKSRTKSIYDEFDEDEKQKEEDKQLLDDKIIEEVIVEDTKAEPKDDELSIIKKLNLDISNEEFPKVNTSALKQKIENSREIESIMSEIARSNDTLDVNIKRNMAELSVKLSELKKMKHTHNYTDDEFKNIQKEILSVKGKIIEQTNEFKFGMNGVEGFEDYNVKKKMKGIENSIIKSRRGGAYVLLSLLGGLAVAFAIYMFVKGFIL